MYISILLQLDDVLLIRALALTSAIFLLLPLAAACTRVGCLVSRITHVIVVFLIIVLVFIRQRLCIRRVNLGEFHKRNAMMVFYSNVREDGTPAFKSEREVLALPAKLLDALVKLADEVNKEDGDLAVGNDSTETSSSASS